MAGGVRTLVVSGAASGIGRAVAERFLRGGWRVLALDVDGQGLAELASTHPGVECVTRTVDVRDRSAVEAAVDEMVLGARSVDACAAIAGISRITPFLDMTDEERDLVLGVNLTGTWNLVRACLPHLPRGERAGRIVVCASIHSVVGGPGMVAYTASKHALVGFVKALALECAPEGITVNAVSPAGVLTPMLRDRLSPEVAERARRTTPLGRFADPDEIAEVVEFLAGDRARYVTGANLIVDGGATAVNVHLLE